MTRRSTAEGPKSRAVHRRTVLAFLGTALTIGGFVTSPLAADKKARLVRVEIKNRKVVAPEGAIRVARGEDVELIWSSDERVRLHLHGYDIELEVPAGKPTRMVVNARVAGRFPITSHGWGSHGHGHDALTYLEVHPR